MLTTKWLRIVTAVAISFAAVNSQAQTAERQDSAATLPAAVQGGSDQSTSSWDDLLQESISIDLSSGSVAQFILSIRASCPQLNIVVTETAGAHRLPEIKLENVPIRGTLSLLSTLTDNEIQVNFQSQEDGNDANIVLISGEDVQNMENALTVRVLNVKRLLQIANREALLSALDEGYRMMENQSSAVEIKIHEATGLLFVKGTPAQLIMAESVVAEIARGFEEPPNTNPYGQTLPERSENAPSGTPKFQ